MNFAHLASFQAIEFMDRPVLKALDIFVYVRQVKTKLSLQKDAIYTIMKNENTSLSHPQSPHFSLGVPSTMTATTTWKELSSENPLRD